MTSISGRPSATLTPITNNDSSSPDKMLSPRAQKRSYDEMRRAGSRSPQRDSSAAAAAAAAASITLTPSQTPPELPRMHARPGPGQIKGYKIAFDPETAPGIDSKDRRKYKPKYNSFGDKVRAASNRVVFPTSDKMMDVPFRSSPCLPLFDG
jgi:hypothetical protein